MTLETRILKIAVLPIGDKIFSERATFIEIDDKAAGEYVKVSQVGDETNQTICIDKNEWFLIREAINKMIKECRDSD